MMAAQTAVAARHDVTVDELMALVAGGLTAIRHTGAESGRGSTHIVRIVLDGLRSTSAG